MELFRIKICGVTCADDAVAVAEAGADALGLNFYPRSPRYVDRDAAKAIVASLPAGIAKVGVFVNAAIDEIQQAVESLGLDFIQLHGDEPPQFCAELGGLDIIRAFRLGAAGWHPLVEYLDQCRERHCLPRAILVDACQAGAYGGTGRATDWNLAREYHELSLGVPALLAGGLNAANVADAIREVKPFGVDTASGVEVRPGQKEHRQVAAFVAAARRALHGIS
jgi:phosphoribosylanthranilate isomerase